MPSHYNGNGGRSGGYVIELTGEPYNGMVLEWGGELVTTTSGAYEGTSQTVILSRYYNKGSGGRNPCPGGLSPCPDGSCVPQGQACSLITKPNDQSGARDGREPCGPGLSPCPDGSCVPTGTLCPPIPGPSRPSPVTKTFRAPSNPRYYMPNGTTVPIGTQLHTHHNGQTMTGHNHTNASVVVTPNSPRGGRKNGMNVGTNTGRRTRTRKTQRTPSQVRNRRTKTQRGRTNKRTKGKGGMY